MTKKLPHPKQQHVGSPEYLALLEQKADLSTKINELNSFLDGEKDPNNAAKINALRIDEAGLLARIADLKEQLATIQKELAGVGSDKMEELYKDMRDKRFFLFINKNKVVFDKELGTLWLHTSAYDSQKEMNWNTAIEYGKKLNIYEYSSWQLPTRLTGTSYLKAILPPKDPKNKTVLDNKTLDSFFATFFKDYTGAVKVYDKIYWSCETYSSDSPYYFYYEGCNFCSKSSNYYAIFCTTPFSDQVPNINLTDAIKHSIKVSGTHPYQPEINLLNFFKEQDFIPFFDDVNLDKIYNSYLQRPKLLTELGKLENKLSALGPVARGLQNGLDFKARVKPYDLEETAYSLVVYYQSLVKWLDELLADLEQFEEDEAEILQQAARLNKTIAAFQSAEAVLTERKDYLAKYLDFGLTNLYQNLIQFKSEAVINQAELKNSRDLAKLYELENKARPSFYTIAEHTADLVSAKLQKIDWFKNNTETLQEISNLHADWAKEYAEFLVSTNKHFFDKCKKQSIDDEVAVLWWQDYGKHRTKIEKSLLSLLKLGLENRVDPHLLISVATKIKLQLTDMVNRFYFEELAPIHQNLFGNIEAAFLEKIETQTKLGKIVLDFEEKLQEEIFKTADKQNRIALCRWAQDWFDVSLAELTANDELINKITAETQNRFRELKKANAELFLNDAHAYAESRKKINDEFTAIMFQIKKELMPKKK